MGATLYEIVESGRNVEQVFNMLSAEATYEYGHDEYNGTIATTSLGGEIKLTNELRKLLKDNDNSGTFYNTFYPEKRTTKFTQELKHFNAYVPEWVENKETVKREKGVHSLHEFAVVDKKGTQNPRYAQRFKTLTAVKRQAKEMAIQKGEDMIIKQFRSNGESFLIGEMNLVTDGKEYKSQRSSKSKVYLPMYKFTFYVYAAT